MSEPAHLFNEASTLSTAESTQVADYMREFNALSDELGHLSAMTGAEMLPDDARSLREMATRTAMCGDRGLKIALRLSQIAEGLHAIAQGKELST